MKEIPNLTFQIKDGPENHTTVSLLRACLVPAPQGGFDFATMRSRMKIEAVLDAVPKTGGASIPLEDSDYATVVQLVQSYRWGIPSKDLIKFAEQFGL